MPIRCFVNKTQMNEALKSIQAEEMHYIRTNCQCVVMSTSLNIIAGNESLRGLKCLEAAFS